MKIPLTPFLVQNRCFIEMYGDFEANLTPHILDELGSLVQIRVRIVRLQDDLSANSLGLPQNRLGLVRIVLWPWSGSSCKPGTHRCIVPSGDLTATIKYRLLDRLMVNGVRCCQTQLLVRERAFFHIEDDERGRQCWHLPGLQLPGILLV